MTDPAIPDTETIEGLRNELAAMTAERDAYRRGADVAKRCIRLFLGEDNWVTRAIDKAMEPFE